MTEKEKETIDYVKKSCLLSINARIYDYKIEMYFSSFSTIFISLFCMMKSPADTLNLFRTELPAIVFYVLLAIAMASIMAFGALNYSRGRPLYDIEKLVEADRTQEAIEIMEEMKKKKSKIEILDTVFLMITVACITFSFSFSYHAKCPYCETKNYVTSSDCSKCGSEMELDKDIIQYIEAEF